MHSDDTADDLELTDVKWVGDTYVPKLRSIGIESPEDLLYADKYAMADLERLGVSKAEAMIQSAHELFEEAWADKQFDPATQRYYDAGPDQWDCVCGRSFDDKTAYTVHMRRCNVAGGPPPVYSTFSVEVNQGVAEVYGDGDSETGFPAIGFTEDQVEALTEFFLMRFELDHLLPDPPEPSAETTDDSEASA